LIPISKLSALEMFHRSSQAALTRLAAAMETRMVAAGESICQEGEPGTALFVVASGVVEVRKNVATEEPGFKKVAQLGPEEIFGEMSFLEQAPYSATVVAQENSEILILPRSEMEKIIQQDPAVVLDQVLTLFSGLSARLRQTTGELVAIFEVARIIGVNPSMEDLSRKVVKLFQPLLGNGGTFGFYIWNLFNDEYSLVWSDGQDWKGFPLIIDGKEPSLSKLADGRQSVEDISKNPLFLQHHQFASGQIVFSPISHHGQKEGLLLCFSDQPSFFNRKHLQLIETTSAVLAPSLSNIRILEEEKARTLYLRNRQQNFG
jgi:CRP-like cAMP-binding protein